MKRNVFLILAFFFNFFSFAQQNHFKDLSPEKQLFCMLSSNLIESNNQSHETLNPDSNGRDLSAKLLENSWDISNYYELLNTLTELADYRHCDNYSSFSNKISKSKNESLIYSAIEYGIPFNQLCFFLYIPYIKDKLGPSENMAWNYGRAITILRWAIGADLIDEEEAEEKAEPFIDAITQNFYSFEDFCCHYLYGASFFYCDHFEDMPEIIKSRFNSFISFITKYGQYFPEKKYFKKTDDNSKALSFTDLLKSMNTDELRKSTEYFSIHKSYKYFEDYENAAKNLDLYKNNKDIKNDFQSIDGTPYFYEVAGNIMLNAGKIQDIQKLYESVENLFSTIPPNSSLHNNIYTLFTFSAFSNKDYIKAIKYSDNITDDYIEIADIYHAKALCYTYRFLDSEEANDIRSADEFLEESIKMYIKACKKGYLLNDIEKEFVLHYTGRSIEEHILPAEDFWKS